MFRFGSTGEICMYSDRLKNDLFSLVCSILYYATKVSTNIYPCHAMIGCLCASLARLMTQQWRKWYQRKNVWAGGTHVGGFWIGKVRINNDHYEELQVRNLECSLAGIGLLFQCLYWSPTECRTRANFKARYRWFHLRLMYVLGKKLVGAAYFRKRLVEFFLWSAPYGNWTSWMISLDLETKSLCFFILNEIMIVPHDLCVWVLWRMSISHDLMTKNTANSTSTTDLVITNEHGFDPQ